jgi:hypothetical protein
MRTPIAAYMRFSGVNAAPRPSKSRLRVSISEDPVQDAGREWDPERAVEEVPAAHREHRPDEEVPQEGAATHRGLRHPRRLGDCGALGSSGGRPAVDARQARPARRVQATVGMIGCPFVVIE